jgi:hypothetical protein
MKYPVEVTIPPAILKSTVSGKTYAVGGKWVEIPEGTTMDDLHKYVVYNRVQHDIKEWKITSASGSTYTLRRINHDRITCNCPGFKFYKNCKHVKKVANESR